MRKLLCFLLSFALLSAVTVNTLATVSGDGAAHAIASSGSASVVIISAWQTNSTATCGASSIAGCPWIGDSNVSTSRGQFLTPGSSLTLPAVAPTAGQSQTYALASIYYLVQTGDKISITLVQ